MPYFLLITLMITFFFSESNAYEELVNMPKEEKQFLSMVKSEHTRFKLLQKKQKSQAEALRLHNLQITLDKEIVQKDEALHLLKKEQSALERLIVKREEKRKREKAKQEKKKRMAARAKRNKLLAKIDISKQRMQVYHRGKLLYHWKVSTGRSGHRTPTGHYKPISIERMHHSRKYNNAAMPYAVFFRSAYAIHGTRSVSRLGKRASHGCVRLHTANAKKFYNLVRKIGPKNTSIRIVY